MEMLGGPIDENVALLRRVRAANRPVHALSNLCCREIRACAGATPFLDEFDTCVVSGHVGVAKPDPRIYEILFARVGRPASELLFIDDSNANLRVSEAPGMAAIHYRPGVDLGSELHARGAFG